MVWMPCGNAAHAEDVHQAVWEVECSAISAAFTLSGKTISQRIPRVTVSLGRDAPFILAIPEETLLTLLGVGAGADIAVETGTFRRAGTLPGLSLRAASVAWDIAGVSSVKVQFAGAVAVAGYP